MRKHALLSPSSAARWMTCPGSVFLCKDIPPKTSVHAEEGTKAHARAEQILSDMLKGKEPPAVIEDFPELGIYINYAKGLLNSGYSLNVEKRVPLVGITTEQAFGTADLVAIKGDTIEIVDLKWGQGVVVEAENNQQLSIYALATMDRYFFLGPFDKVRITVVQPRVASSSNGVSTWETTARSLETKRKEIKLCAAKALDQYEGESEPTYCPSKKACRWCLAAGKCAAYAKMVSDTTAAEFPVLDEATINDAKRAEIFKKLEDVRAWVEQFESEILAEALAGKKFPGLKLVLGRAGIRKWKDEQTADDLLEGFHVETEWRYKRKLISPTEAEKLFKAGQLSEEQWKRLGENVIRPEPKPILVSAEDKREEYNVADLGNEFSDLTK